MPDQPSQNLSATRGGSFGIWWFRMLLRYGGMRLASAFVPCITFFYALFDKTAFRAAQDYLRLRFPNAGFLALRLHFWRLITEQGRMLLGSYAVADGRKIEFAEVGPEDVRDLVRSESCGVIILLSHFGCWQAATAWLDGFPNRTFHILAQPDANPHLSKLISCSAHNIHFIPTTEFGGGLMDALNALEHGGALCMMGDRAAGGDSFPAPFFNGNLDFPLSPWLLASRSSSVVVPVFTCPNPQFTRIEILYGRPVRLHAPPNRRATPDELASHAISYAQDYETLCQKYPYLMFRFDGNKK